MSANDWTEERTNELKRLWLLGWSAGAISKAIGGVSRNAVIGKVHRLGLPERSADYTRTKKRTRSDAERPTPHRNLPVVTVREIRPRQTAPKRAHLTFPNKRNRLFAHRLPGECPMFLEGQSGDEGFICAAPVERGSWCEDCRRVVYAPEAPKQRKAA